MPIKHQSRDSKAHLVPVARSTASKHGDACFTWAKQLKSTHDGCHICAAIRAALARVNADTSMHPEKDTTD